MNMSEFRDFIGYRVSRSDILVKTGTPSNGYTPESDKIKTNDTSKRGKYKEFICVDCLKPFTFFVKGRPPIRCPTCKEDKTHLDFPRIFLDLISLPDVACWCTPLGVYHLIHKGKDYVSDISFKECYKEFKRCQSG